jgi:hypothetical protein
MNSSFYAKLAESNTGYTYQKVKRWTRKSEIFSRNQILVPIHCHGNHWTLAVINIVQKRFEYYDSLRGPPALVLDHLRQWLQDESEDKLKRKLDLSDWTDVCFKKGAPLQRNGHDCAVFMCKTAEYIAQDGVLDFKQANMSYMRRTIVAELLSLAVLANTAAGPAATNPHNQPPPAGWVDNGAGVGITGPPASLYPVLMGPQNNYSYLYSYTTSTPQATTSATAGIAVITDAVSTTTEGDEWVDNGAGVGITGPPASHSALHPVLMGPQNNYSYLYSYTTGTPQATTSATAGIAVITDAVSTTTKGDEATSASAFTLSTDAPGPATTEKSKKDARRWADNGADHVLLHESSRGEGDFEHASGS